MDHDYLKHSQINKHDKILVLGAYTGDFMREYQTSIVANNAYVINLEPNLKYAIDCLVYIAHHLMYNACFLQAACSAFDGLEKFSEHSYRQLGHLTNTGVYSDTGYILNYFYVPTFSLATLLRTFQPTKIFCDIEGAELEVFNGAGLQQLPYTAIAAYHLRNNKSTYTTLMKRFDELKLNTILDPIPNGEIIYVNPTN